MIQEPTLNSVVGASSLQCSRNDTQRIHCPISKMNSCNPASDRASFDVEKTRGCWFCYKPTLSFEDECGFDARQVSAFMTTCSGLENSSQDVAKLLRGDILSIETLVFWLGDCVQSATNSLDDLGTLGLSG